MSNEITPFNLVASINGSNTYSFVATRNVNIKSIILSVSDITDKIYCTLNTKFIEKQRSFSASETSIKLNNLNLVSGDEIIIGGVSSLNGILYIAIFGYNL